MRGAGIGDMAAKAISIAEWRISHLVTGEYLCEPIAGMTLSAFRETVDHAAEIMRGELRAVRGLAEGLILSGIASSMAQVSRPASGSEHTVSHLMDMLTIARGLPHNLHGAQVGYGVRLALAAYDALLEADDPLRYAAGAAAQYHPRLWERDMRRVFGTQADSLIADAQREGRNTPEALRSRTANAAAHWPEIQAVLQGVAAQKQQITAALDIADIPQLREPQHLGLSPGDVLDAFVYARDLRSRYIFPGLVSDLGLMPWMRERLQDVLGITQDRPRYFDGT
jgi:glycerol-1-phosphate dehydrogenase [NAD(P)+]